MNNEISNPKTEVPTGISLNDKDYLNNLLSLLKDMNKNYCVAMTEASNEDLYKKIYNMFDDISKLQRETFELSFKNGWYKLETADTNKINEKQQTLNQELQDLNV